jgi:hypothetical protein
MDLLRSWGSVFRRHAELNANRMFYAIAALAYNILIALKLLHLPDDCQNWQLKTLLRQVLLIPQPPRCLLI